MLVSAVLPADGRPEVPQPVSEGTPCLGKSLGAEHDQRDDEDEQKVRWLQDVADHCNQEYPACLFMFSQPSTVT